MKRLTAIALAMLLFSGTASAQSTLPNGNLLGALLGDGGVVPGLFVTLTTLNAEPLVDSLAGPTGIVQGTGGESLHKALGGLLVQPVFDLETTLNGVSELLLTGPSGGLLGGLAGPVFGGNGLSGNGFGGGLLAGGMVSGSGQGLAAGEIPLENLDPSTQSALANGVTLSGLE